MDGVHAHVFRSIGLAALIVDGAGVILTANAAAHRVLGYERGGMIGGRIHDIAHLETETCDACARLGDGQVHRDVRGVFRRSDGDALAVVYDVVPLEGQASGGAMVSFWDRTDQDRLHSELEHLRLIVDEAPAFISTADKDGHITYFNKKGREWLGLPPEQQPKGWRLAPASLRVAQNAAQNGKWRGERANFLANRPGAKPGRTVLQTVMAHRGPDEQVEFFTTVAIDISAEKQLEEERLRLLAIIEESPDFISTADTEGRLLSVNRAGRRMVGIGPSDDVTQLRIKDLHPEWAYLTIWHEGLPTAANVGEWHGETTFLGRHGIDIPVLQSIVAHKDEAGAVRYFSTIARDISARKRMEARLHYLANYDGLTGAMNRTGFQNHLEKVLRQAIADNTPGALLYFDLDNFKDINDSFGHPVGDDMLRRVVEAVQGHLRSDDVLGRLGGDEFGIVLPRTRPEDAKAIGERVLAALNEQTALLDGKIIPLRASIGVATFPTDAATVTDLLVHADLAMYAAKGRGGNRVVVGSRPRARRAHARARLDRELACRRALQNGGFVLYWQPLVDVHRRHPVAYELLLRLREADGQLLLPGEFLPVCERAGLIHEVDRWVIQQGLRLLARRKDLDGLRLHVNLSGTTFSDPGFLPAVEEALREHRADPSRMVIEITETSAIENLNRASGFVKALRQMGFMFALDDFGVGFSSLSLLRRLPIDTLKIDGSFVENVLTDSVDRHLVAAMVQVAAGFGQRTVAERVPDEPTMRVLAELGVDWVQGFFIGRPAPVDEGAPEIGKGTDKSDSTQRLKQGD